MSGQNKTPQKSENMEGIYGDFMESQGILI